jgi:hypothetical protein
MTSSSNSTINDSKQYSHSHKGCCTKGNWSGINIAAMVIGFVLFWPVGLLVLYWNISGRHVKDLPSAIQEKWSAMFNGSFEGAKGKKGSKSENSLFEEFQQTQYDRITEIKDEIKNRARSFKDFRSNAKRRADEAEFNEFMSSDQSKSEK